MGMLRPRYATHTMRGYYTMPNQSVFCLFLFLFFVIHKRILPHVNSVVRVSDNVCYLNLTIPNRNGTSTQCRIVNCYGPTSPQAHEDMFFFDCHFWLILLFEK